MDEKPWTGRQLVEYLQARPHLLDGEVWIETGEGVTSPLFTVGKMNERDVVLGPLEQQAPTGAMPW